MKGRKIDYDFVSKFITNSIHDGVNEPDLMIDRAQGFIDEIDSIIRKAEQAKLFRSKYLNIIEVLKKTSKNNAKEIEFLNKIYKKQ